MTCEINFKGNLYSKSEFQEFMTNNVGEFVPLVSLEEIKEINTTKYLPTRKLEMGESVSKMVNMFKVAEQNATPEILSGVQEKHGLVLGTEEFSSMFQREAFGSLFESESSPLQQYTRDFISGVLSNEKFEDLTTFERSLFNIVTNKKNVLNKAPEFNSDTHSLLTNDKGEYEVVKNSDILNRPIKDINDAQYALDQILEDLTNKEFSVVNTVNMDLILTPKQKLEAKEKLYSILDKLGVSTMSLRAYQEAYKSKHGIDPSVEALADITNKVVALAEGGAPIEHLSEEVSHFLVEAYHKQSDIDAALPLVEGTNEWAQYSNQYRNLYSQQGLQGEALENKVRREVLGKIIAQSVVNKLTQTEAHKEADSLVTTFLNRLKAFFNPTIKNSLTELVDRITEGAFEEAKFNNTFSEEQLNSSMFDIFYSATPSTITTNLKNALDSMEKQMNVLQNEGTGRSVKMRINTLATHVQNGDILQGTSTYLDMINSLLSDVKRKVKVAKELEAKGQLNGPILLGPQQTSARLLMTEGDSHLNTLRAELVAMDLNSMTPEQRLAVGRLITKLDSYSTDISTLGGELKRMTLQRGEELFEELMEENQLPERARNWFRNQLNSKLHDLGKLMTYFGNMQNSSNPILNLISKMVNKMYTKVRSKDNKVFRVLYDKLNALGTLDRMKDIVKKDKDGKATNYLESIIDFAQFETDMNNEKIRLYNEALSNDPEFSHIKPITKIHEIGRDGRPKIFEFEDSVREAYETQIDQWMEDNTESPYNTSIKKMREDMFDTIAQGITLPSGEVVTVMPDEAKQMMADWARRRREIKEPYTKGGIVNYADMTEADRLELESIKKERKMAASLLNPVTMENKTGIERDIALAFQAMNVYYSSQKASTRTMKQEFTETLAKFSLGATTEAEKRAANIKALEFFSKNSGFAFNETFWNAIQTNNETITEKVEEYINNNPGLPREVELRTIAKKLEDALKNRSSFLKQYANPLNPAEVDVSSMSGDMMTAFSNLETDIEGYYNFLKAALGPGSGIVNPISTESTTNEAFLEAFNEAQITRPGLTEIEFAQEHMTSGNKAKVILFQSQLDSYNRTQILPITGNFKFVVTKLLGLPDGATPQEIKTTLENYQNNPNNAPLDELYAKSKMLGYFKRFAPKGFAELMERLKTGDLTDSSGNLITFAEFIENINNGSGFKFTNSTGTESNVTQYMSLNAEVEWLEDPNGVTDNPFYLKNRTSTTSMVGRIQPKVSKYKDSEFVRKYNIDEDAYFKTGRLASKGTTPDNDKLLETINLLVENRYEALRHQGLHESENAFKRPQVRKSELERSAALAKGNIGKNAVRGVREAWENTMDKMLYGETVSGEVSSDSSDINNLKVPVLNVRNLEDPSELSDDILFAYMTHTHNAHLYAERMEVASKMNQLEQLMLDKQKLRGKSIEASNAHKWLQDYKKVNVYGVSELQKIELPFFNRKLNLTNAMRAFDSFQGSVNVGFNPAVSVTAGTSGFIFSVTEALIGDYIPTKSYKVGAAKYAANATAFLTNAGKVDNKSEIYTFGEKYGVFRMTERVNGSQFNRALRTLFKDGVIHGTAHFMTEILTHPYAPTAMYGVMHDLRYVETTDSNGNKVFKLMNYNEFKYENAGNFATRKEMEVAWTVFEENSVLNNTTNNNGDVEYSDKFKGIWDSMHPNDAKGVENEMLFMENAISSGTENLVSKVDAKMPQYDKSAASRHAILKFALRHREWFTINFQNRWKSRHYNSNTRREEEGSYITLFKYIFDFYKAFEFKGGASNYKNFKKEFDKLDDVQKSNMKRVLIDSAISVLLVLIGSSLIAPMVDDDENKDNWLLQYAGYMYFRLASEQMTSGLSGIPQSKDVIEAPFVAVNSMKELMKPSNYSLEEVDRGVYEGHSKIFRLIAKQTHARHYYDMRYGINEKSNFFRLNNEWSLWFMDKTSKKEKEEQEAKERELSGMFQGPDRPGLR